MKIKSRFKGKEHDIPMQLQKAFNLNNGISSAKLKIDYLGNYSLTVPYNVTEATARRSIYYKPTMEELTQQMMNAYTDSTFAFSHIVSKCHTIETDILYQKRLNNLQPETYSPKICSEPQPTRNAVEKELMDEANQKYYRLFWGNKSAKKKYVSDNIESVYNERLRHWGEVVTYFGYVESVIKAKKGQRIS